VSENWRENANCAGLDVDMFFPVKSAVTDTVKKICDNCFVKKECAAFAISIPEISGYWGGTTERERQKLRSKRKQKITH
jgi:WhiB family redox-sensing transcriptional regulator